MIRNVIISAVMVIGALLLVELVGNTLEQRANHDFEAYAPPLKPYSPGPMK
jgi:hypothetical protein